MFISKILTDLCAIKQSGLISFKNFKQLPVPLKIYVDFECILKGDKSSDKKSCSLERKKCCL